MDQAVADIFGYHALQLGMPELDALRANRMPHRWLALDRPIEPDDEPDEAALNAAIAPQANLHRARRAALVTDFTALPFPESSLDLVVLPHALELSADPHAALREVGRVLVPEGRAVICGLNPASLWGLRERRAKVYQRLGFGEPYLPHGGAEIGFWRLRDWLRLLSFEVEASSFGLWQPAARSEAWLKRMDWMNRAGRRWWPIFGALYFVVATKRVRGVRLLGTAWKEPKPIASAPVPVANKTSTKTRTRQKNKRTERPTAEIQ